jgi:hypothetical protein
MAAMDSGVEGKSAVEEAKQVLIELLAGGPMEQKEVKKAIEGAGLSWATVRRAKGKLGIKPHKDRMVGPWTWALPKVLKSCEGAQASEVSIFGADEHLRAARADDDRTAVSGDADPFASLKDPSRRL